MGKGADEACGCDGQEHSDEETHVVQRQTRCAVTSSLKASLTILLGDVS